MSALFDHVDPNDAGSSMTLVDHLQEFRKRLLIAVVFTAISSFSCYLYADELVQLITAPAGKLYYMNPAEAFFVYLKVSLFCGLVLASPIVLYQIWAFIVPALTKNERKASLLFVPASVFLFFVGLAFSFFLVLPAGIKFFMGFGTETLMPLFSIDQYITLVISFLLPFGVVFQMPLLIVAGAKFGLIDSAILIAKRKLVIVMSFVIGAVIAPSPDVVSQTMVAVPLLVLYELSILIVRGILRK